MKTFRQITLIGLTLAVFVSALPAQTNVPASTNAPARHVNPAIVPVSREGGATNRQEVVLKRAKDNPGECDIAFLGDSITQGWEGNGKDVWTNYYGRLKCLNFGVGGDRTQHVLWRLAHGQLDLIRPKVTVLMIGTNNSNKDDNSEGEILQGILAIIHELVERCPDTKILVLGIFPRGQTFSAQRGKILQVNQALAKVANGQAVHYLDFGSQLVERNGSISKDLMPDYLHLSKQGYTLWAEAMAPKLKELLAN